MKHLPYVKRSALVAIVLLTFVFPRLCPPSRYPVTRTATVERVSDEETITPITENATKLHRGPLWSTPFIGEEEMGAPPEATVPKRTVAPV